jgi:ABC-type Mn2+/Zn2+ transport system ATPase subunit
MTAAHLQIETVVCSFGIIRAVDEVELDLQPGEHVALIGSNGSGKTTLLRAVLGLHPLSAGRILLDDLDAVSFTDWKKRRARIAWMPQRQTTGQFPLLVHEFLQSSIKPASAFFHAQELGIGTLLDRSLHTLSGGQLQRVFLARALGSIDGGAGILLADEPTSALDFDGQVKVAEILRALPATILVVTHDRTMADRCERVVEMAGGRLREVRA